MKNIKKGVVIGSLVIMSTIFLSFKSDFFEVAKQMEIYTTLFKELNLYYIDEINPAELTEGPLMKCSVNWIHTPGIMMNKA